MICLTPDDATELKIIIIVTRAKTGIVETFEIVGKLLSDKDIENGSNTLNGSQERSD